MKGKKEVKKDKKKNIYQVFMRRYLSLWKQNPYNSFLKFKLANSGWYKIKTFSTLQSKQKFVTGDQSMQVALQQQPKFD